MPLEESITDTLRMTVPTSPAAHPPSLPPVSRVRLLGVYFDCLKKSEALDRIVTMAQTPSSSKHICLANAYTVAMAQEDQAFRNLLNRADLVLADGMSIVWGGRWVGLNLPQRIAGPDLMSSLCGRAAEEGLRIFLLGSSWENLGHLKKALLAQSPTLQIAGSYSPPMCDELNAEENAAIYAQLQAARPDILFVGLSAPKQEKWLDEHLARLQVPVCLGVGAAFDFLSGRIPRAPVYFQEAGLEWLFRLYCEPRRLWKRYVLGNLLFLYALVKEILIYHFHTKRLVPSSKSTNAKEPRP